MALSLSLSCYLLLEHLSAYKNPEVWLSLSVFPIAYCSLLRILLNILRGFFVLQEQKFLIGVILMVPFYAIESFISLVHPSISVDVGILRDCYESFAMYCFGRYLVACLGGEERAIEFMDRQGRASTKTPLLEHGKDKGTVKHPFPMNYFLKPWRLGQWFYQIVKFGIVQYMIIKAFTSILTVVLEAFGVYCEGEFKWDCGYPYIAVVLNFSQSWALYCLVQFYTATKEELAHINPLYKFLTFKSIVFLTWWQGVAIALLYSLGLFRSPIAQGLQFKSSVQDLIICVEIVNDVKFTVTQAVEPVEKGITKFNEKLHKISENMRKHDKDKKRTKDDSCLDSSPRVIRGIDDPLLNGSLSDNGAIRTKKHRRKSDYNSGESGGESSSDQNYGGYQVRGRRWITKD
ncbi:Protein LAZ1 [Linum grandiflorum]